MSAVLGTFPSIDPEDVNGRVLVRPTAGRRRRPSRRGLLVLSADLLALTGTYLVLVLCFDQSTVDVAHLVVWCVALVLTWVFVGTGRAYSAGILHHPYRFRRHW